MAGSFEIEKKNKSCMEFDEDLEREFCFFSNFFNIKKTRAQTQTLGLMSNMEKFYW